MLPVATMEELKASCEVVVQQVMCSLLLLVAYISTYIIPEIPPGVVFC
jgi:hypothetical protein